MATVFALVLLPAIFAVGLMALVVGGDTGIWSYLAFLTFGVLAGGTFYGLLQMTRRWEDEPV